MIWGTNHSRVIGASRTHCIVRCAQHCALHYALLLCTVYTMLCTVLCTELYTLMCTVLCTVMCTVLCTELCTVLSTVLHTVLCIVRCTQHRKDRLQPLSHYPPDTPAMLGLRPKTLLRYQNSAFLPQTLGQQLAAR